MNYNCTALILNGNWENNSWGKFYFGVKFKQKVGKGFKLLFGEFSGGKTPLSPFPPYVWNF